MSESLSGQVLNVQELKRVADEKETEKLKEVLARRQKEEAEEHRARQDFMEREIRPDGIERFNGWVRRAAEQAGTRSRSCAFPRNTARITAGRSTTSRRAGPRR
jgi:hypothetical protein